MTVIELIEQFAWIGWIIVIVLFLVIEMLSLDFTFLMLAVGGVAGLLADLVGAPLWLQVVIAAAVGGLLVFVLRPRLLRLLHRGEDPTLSNVPALIGMDGQVLSTTTSIAGQVKLTNGDIWTARTAGAQIEPGTAVRVARIDGATAFVTPADDIHHGKEYSA